MGTTQILYAGGGLVLSRFDCPPEHPAWSRTNTTGRWPLIAFPGTPVWIEHEGGAPFVADQTVAVLYRPGQEYERRLLDPTGDHCTVVGMDERLLFGVQAGDDDEPDGRAFTASTVGVASAVRLGYRRVLWAIRSDPPPDPMWVQETLLLAVGAAVRAQARVSDRGGRSPRAPGGTANAARREAVEEAKAVLGIRFRDAVTLEDVARAVHLSQYHLARVFRAETGSTVHRYLTDIRLRAALDAMEPSGGDLSRIAAEAGFAHHSHLTDQFTRRFGMPPSRARRRDAPIPAGNRAGS